MVQVNNVKTHIATAAFREAIKPHGSYEKFVNRALDPNVSKSHRDAHKAGMIALAVLLCIVTLGFGAFLVKKVAQVFSDRQNFINAKVDLATREIFGRPSEGPDDDNFLPIGRESLIICRQVLEFVLGESAADGTSEQMVRQEDKPKIRACLEKGLKAIEAEGNFGEDIKTLLLRGKPSEDEMNTIGDSFAKSAAFSDMVREIGTILNPDEVDVDGDSGDKSRAVGRDSKAPALPPKLGVLDTVHGPMPSVSVLPSISSSLATPPLPPVPVPPGAVTRHNALETTSHSSSRTVASPGDHAKLVATFMEVALKAYKENGEEEVANGGKPSMSPEIQKVFEAQVGELLLRRDDLFTEKVRELLIDPKLDESQKFEQVGEILFQDSELVGVLRALAAKAGLPVEED